MSKNNTLLNTGLILEKIQVKEKMRVADLGCGSHCHFVFPISKIVGRYGTVYAVDILKDVLGNVQKQANVESLKNIKTVWTDLEIFGATKIESNSLDLVLLVNTLYQSKKQSEIIREAARLLKKDGELFIADCAFWSATRKKSQNRPFKNNFKKSRFSRKRRV